MPDQPKPYLRIDQTAAESFTCEYLYAGEVRTNATANRATLHAIIDMVFPPNATPGATPAGE